MFKNVKNTNNKTLNIKKILVIILICSIVLFSTSVFAIYKVMTIGNKALTFTLKVETANTSTNPTIVNSPKLLDGMIPVVWNETNSKWKVVSASDPNWYNYISGKIWANAIMPDTTSTTATFNLGDEIEEADLGSMFVWIPKYEYKINYFTDAAKTIPSETQTLYGTIEVNFIAPDITSASTNYVIHPSFMNGTSNNFENGEWDSNISGFWMSKFEMSKEINESGTWEMEHISASSSGDINVDNNTTRMVSKPNKESWTHISIAKAFSSSKLSTYNLTSTDAAKINSHLMKNSEWGAVAYLAYSSFGKNSQPNINSYMPGKTSLCTGFGSNAVNSAQITNTTINDKNRYNGQTGINASTTGNIYGIYDISGGASEFSAASMVGGSALDSNSSSNKYYTMYTTGNMKNNGKIGDATKETYNWDSNAVGNSSNAIDFNISDYFLRGGGATNGNTAGRSGLFSFFTTNGNNSSYFRGFRTVLIINE